MDIVMILTAFALGFVVSLVRLPPLVGYLAAGFVLHAFGRRPTAGIDEIAAIGILLLLFAIGLKFDARVLARPEIWAGATLHMTATVGTVTLLALLGRVIGIEPMASLDGTGMAVLGVALAFSSTVFAVKALEVRNEAMALFGRLSIAVLVLQDIVAVGFLALTAGTAPSPWAIPVIAGMVASRPLFHWVLTRIGHGELMLLFGVLLALGAAEVFGEVGLKRDAGALLMGVVLAGRPRAKEMADALLSLKDLFLVAFFLSIGLGGIAGWEVVVAGVATLAVVPAKSLGYLLVLTRFRLRVRTAWHTAATLSTHSEFGLIVVVAAVGRGWLDPVWAQVLAIAIAASFAAAAPLDVWRYDAFRRFGSRLQRLERSPTHPDDAVIDPGPARVLVFGMGRIGTGAYDELVERLGSVVVGVDRRDATVAAAGERRIVRGDALDPAFWERVRLRPEVDLVVLAMSDHDANLEAVRRVRQFLPSARIAATAAFPDEVVALEAAGVDVARNLYGEAGQGLADDACDLISGGGPRPMR